MRAGLALLRAGLLAAQKDLESGLAVLEAGAEDLGDWQLMTSIKEQSAVREAVLSAELGERDQAARLVGGDDERPCSLPAAILLAQLKLAEHDATPAREVMAPWTATARGPASPAEVQAWTVDALRSTRSGTAPAPPTRWSARSSSARAVQRRLHRLEALDMPSKLSSGVGLTRARIRIS